MKLVLIGVFLTTIGLGVFVEAKDEVKYMSACVAINDTIYYDVPYSIEKCNKTDSLSNLLFIFNVRSK